MDFTQDPGTKKSFTRFLNLLNISSAKFSRTNFKNSTLQNNEVISQINNQPWKSLQDQNLDPDVELNDLINLVSSTLQELKAISGSNVLKTFRPPENSTGEIPNDKDYVTTNLSFKNSIQNLMSSIYIDDCQTTPIYTDARSIRGNNNYSKDSGYVDNRGDFDLINNIMKSSTMLNSSSYLNTDRIIPKHNWKSGDAVNEMNRSYPLEYDENYIEKKANDNLSKIYNTQSLESPWDSKFAKSFSPINIKNNLNNFKNQDRVFSASPVRCNNMEEMETVIPTRDKNFKEITEHAMLINEVNDGINSEKIQQSSLNRLNNLREDTSIVVEDKKLNFNQASLKSISDTGYITDEEVGQKMSQLGLSSGFTTSKICNVDQEISQMNFTNGFTTSTRPCVGLVSECQLKMTNGRNLFKDKRDHSNTRNRKNLAKENCKSSLKRTNMMDVKKKNIKHDVVHDGSKQMMELLPHKYDDKLSSRYIDKISPRSPKIKDTIKNCKAIEKHVKPLTNLKGTTNSVKNPKFARTKVSMKSQDSNKVFKDNNRTKVTENRVENIKNIAQEYKRIPEEPSGVRNKCGNNVWEKVIKPTSTNITKRSEGSKLELKRQGNVETRSKIPVGKSCGDIQNSITPCKRFQTPQSVLKVCSIKSGKESARTRSLGEKKFNSLDIGVSQDLLSKDNRNLIDLEENRVTRICQCLAETKAQQRYKCSSSKELSIVTENQFLNDEKDQCFSSNQSVSPSKRCESVTFGKSSETNVNKSKFNSKTRPGTPKRFSTTTVGQNSLQNINERFEKPKVIKMLEEIINDTPKVLKENNLLNKTERTIPHSIKLSITSLQNNDLKDQLNSNNKIISCIKSSSVTGSRSQNNKVLYDTDMNDSDTLPIKLSMKYINVTSNAQLSESQTDTDMEEIFKNQSKKSVALQKETDYSSGTDGREYAIDSKTVTDIDHSCSNAQLTLTSLTDVPWGFEFTSDYSTSISTYAKDCQTSLPSLLSSSKTLQNGILEEYANKGAIQKETCENSQESLNRIRKALSENCTKSNHSLKKQFLNKHAKSLHVLKEILKCQELSVDFLNAAERELKNELHDKVHSSEREIYINTNLLGNSKIESRSQNFLNTDISDRIILGKQRNSNEFIDSEKSFKDLQPERLDRDPSMVFSNNVDIRNCSCTSSCKINNFFKGNEMMSKDPSNLVAKLEPVSLVCTKSKETSCKLKTVTEEEEVSCKPEDFPSFKKEITTQASFTREVFTESEFFQTICTQTGQHFSLRDIAISSEDDKELITKKTKSTSCDTIPNYQTVGIECTEQLNMLYNSKNINTDHVVTSTNEVTIFQQGTNKNVSIQAEDIPKSRKLVTDTFTETLESCYSFDVPKNIIGEEELNTIIILCDNEEIMSIEEAQSNNIDRSYQNLILKCDDTFSAYTAARKKCREKLPTFRNNYLKKQASEDIFVQLQLMSGHNQNLDAEIYRKKFGKSSTNVCRENSFFHLVQAISITSFNIQETNKHKKEQYDPLKKPIKLSLNLKTTAPSSNDISVKFIANTSAQMTHKKVLPKIKVFIHFLLNHLRHNFHARKSSQKNGFGDDSTVKKESWEYERDQKALWSKNNEVESLKRKRIKDYEYTKCSQYSRQQLFAYIYAVLCSIVFCSFQFSHFCES
ncbi:uncharacterized protein LOC107266156 isoform X2 [Cephus cinctus]|uniref:Uncharacterized protein LOC107266156 isoform X2 n=1 Tax=Cephus cinctus TaxID=211228 RepID=A0AAJ7BQD7_CEPCN|nr:uncharacterized protein LOC107266156 isoform X2 [Cephus cinctus]